MQKLDQVVCKETKYISAWTLIFSVILQAVFLIIGKWDITVLFGNLLGAAAAVINFLLMGIGVQYAVTQEEKQAKQTMKLSSTLRTFFLFAVAVLGVLLPCFQTVSALIPLFFPRIAIAIRPLWDKKDTQKEDSSNEK